MPNSTSEVDVSAIERHWHQWDNWKALITPDCGLREQLL